MSTTTKKRDDESWLSLPGDNVNGLSSDAVQALTALHNLEQSLRCFYCDKLFQIPIISVNPCHHCFCSECLSEEWGKTLSSSSYMICAVCNSPMEGNLETFQRNRGLEDTLGFYLTVKPLLRNTLQCLLAPKEEQEAATTNSATGATAAASAPGAVKTDAQRNSNTSITKKPRATGTATTSATNGRTVAGRLSWDEYYEELVIFKNKFGHTRVRYQKDGDVEFKKFADWVRNQRYLLAKRSQEEGPAMAPIYFERIDKLNEIGFDWVGESQDAGRLSLTTAEDGRADLSGDHDDDEVAAYHSTSRVQKGTRFQAKWDEMYSQLSDHFEQHGSAVVSNRDTPQLKKLHDWSRNQKYLLGKKMKEGRLSPVSAERVEKLEALNIHWRIEMGDQQQQEGDDGGRKPRAVRHPPKLPASAAAAKHQLAMGNNTALAATLGKVLGALDNLGALENLGGAGGDNADRKPASRKRPNSFSRADIGEAAAQKRDKLERKLEMVSSQLVDAEANVTRFQTVSDASMAEQAKARMVDLYNKKVELEQSILTVLEEAAEEEEPASPSAAAGGPRGKFRRLNTPKRDPAQHKRTVMEMKLELTGQHLTEAEKSVARFQGIRDSSMVDRAKERMAQLYNQKVEIENGLMELDEEAV